MSKTKVFQVSQNDPDNAPNDGSEKPRKSIPAYRDTFVHFLFGTPGNEPILLHFLNAVFQTSERKTFADRMTYYTEKSLGGQMVIGEAYALLKAVIVIAVTTFEMFPQLRGLHNSFYLKAKANPDVIFTEKLQMHLLEACKEKIHRVDELPSALGTWTNFFYFSHIKSEEEMTALLQDQPIVTQAYEKYKQFNQDERLRSIDEAHQRFLTDIASDRAEARAEARQEGREEGMRDIAIARNMRNEGFDTGVISKITGLSPTEIERLN